MKSTLIVPTWNEIRGMQEVMPRVRPEWVDQIIVVDGGSTDGTIEFAREKGYTLHVQQRRGMRNAYNEILPLIEGDFVITFSPDGNCIPEDIPKLIEKMGEGYDMVIASRYAQGAGSKDDDAVTGFGNFLFTKTVNVLFRARYTDALGIYRAYKTELIYELELNREEPYVWAEKLFRTNISWEPLLSVRAAKAGKRVTEIPSPEPARVGGERKLQVWRWGAAYYAQFWKEAIWR